MSLYFGRDSCERVRQERDDLQAQLDRQRYEREEVAERDYQQREEERRQRARDAAEAMNYADDWLDAFSKGLRKYRDEAREEIADNARWEDDPARKPSTGFQEAVLLIERAQAIYNEVNAEAERRIAQIKAETLLLTAERIEAQMQEESDEYDTVRGLIRALREDDPNWLTHW